MLQSSITALELEQTFAPSIVEAELLLVQKCKETKTHCGHRELAGSSVLSWFQYLSFAGKSLTRA